MTPAGAVVFVWCFTVYVIIIVAFEGDFFECKKRAAHTGDHLAVVEGTKGEKIRVYWK